jgi:hypothetical protein
MLEKTETPKQIVRGAKAIAPVIGAPNERAAYHLLEGGHVRGSFKMGFLWHLNVPEFLKSGTPETIADR